MIWLMVEDMVPTSDSVVVFGVRPWVICCGSSKEMNDEGDGGQLGWREQTENAFVGSCVGIIVAVVVKKDNWM